MNSGQIIETLFIIAALLFFLTDITRLWREKQRDRRSCPKAAPLESVQLRLVSLLDQHSDTVKIEVKPRLPGQPQVVTVHFEKRGQEPLTAETVKAVRRQVRNMLLLPKDTPVHLVDQGGHPHGDDVPEETEAELVHYQHLYFKLPLEGVEYHWQFREREKFLAGSLKLVISRGEERRTIEVFSHGVIDEGWKTLGSQGESRRIYFGFSSLDRYPVTLGDTVELVFDSPYDLDGIGPDNTGVLAAGQYRSRSPFKMYLFDSYDERPTAFLVDWNQKWPLTLTGNQGWMEAHKAKPAQEP